MEMTAGAMFDRESDLIFDALESYMLSIDLFGVDDEEEHEYFGAGTEAVKNEIVTTRNNEEIVTEKKKGGLVATVKSILKAIGDFFKRIFMGDDGEVLKAIQIEYPATMKDPNKFMDEIIAEWSSIVDSNNSANPDPTAIEKKLRDLMDKCKQYSKDLTDEKKIKSGGVKTFTLTNKAAKVSRAFKKEIKVTGKEIDMLRYLQKYISSIMTSVERCRISGTYDAKGIGKEMDKATKQLQKGAKDVEKAQTKATKYKDKIHKTYGGQ